MKKIISIALAGLMAFSFTACEGLQKNNGRKPVQSDEGPHVHQCTKIRAKDATCLKEGNIEYYSCFGCDEIYADETMSEKLSFEDVIIPKLSHAIVAVDEAEAVCDRKGNVAYWYCENCFTFFEDADAQVEIEEKGNVQTEAPHSLVYRQATAPHGYQNGHIAHWECEDCEGLFADEEGRNKITQASTVVLSAFNIVDFVVEVDENKDPVVLQLTDTQIIDAGQTRPGRGGIDFDFWATDKMAERCYNYIEETIEATKPDLILLTGDVVYGEFDDNGTALTSFIEFMEGFQIPWAPIFGNHENESKMGVDWQCEQFENAEYCLFEQKTLTGNGNYSVAIAQGGEIKRAFYMLDSNGCGGASDESKANGQMKMDAGFGADQIAWYTQEITALKAISPNTKISFAYHIQSAIFEKAYEKYGFNQGVLEQNINLDRRTDTANTDFGFIGRQLKNPWDKDYSIFNGMKALGADSIFVGHEHCNSASVVYEGVRFQFGQKSSEYDRYNFLNADGSITSSAGTGAKSLMGGTVIPLSKNDGAITTPYIYYCGYPNGQIDWSQWN